MKKILLGSLLLALVVILTACGCKHEETELIDAVEPTCVSEGYSGDTYCLKCKKVITKGKTLEMLPHSEGKLENAKEATCTEEGYTGDTYCINCGQCLVVGEAIPARGHSGGELVGVCDPTCITYGYTGDVFCSACNERLREGEFIEKLPHVPGELQNVREATCYSEGYSGDIYCSVCNECLEVGYTLPRLSHTLSEAYDVVEATCLAEGYTGTRNCVVCDAVIEGETVPKLEHAFVDNICTACEWRVPGLYVENELVMTWEQLVNGGYIKVDGNVLMECAKSLMGMLVVSEDITELEGQLFFKAEELESVYLPVGVTSLCTNYSSRGYFEGCTKLKEVRFFGPMVDIGYKRTFQDCVSLKEFVVPEGVSFIGDNSFSGCTSLEKLIIPDSVTSIETGAIDNTPSLNTLELPKNLEEIGIGTSGTGRGDFYNCGPDSIVLPASVTKFEFSGATFTFIDASACAWEKIEDYAFYESTIRGIKLPATLKAINYGAFADCKHLELLILPEGFESMHDNSKVYSPFKGCDMLSTVVWPVSFIDGTKLSPKYCPNLKTIYYRGSEFQWNLTVSKDLFTDVNVVFNYEGDGSEFFEQFMIG